MLYIFKIDNPQNFESAAMIVNRPVHQTPVVRYTLINGHRVNFLVSCCLLTVGAVKKIETTMSK